jgi:hypothetical protein
MKKLLSRMLIATFFALTLLGIAGAQTPTVVSTSGDITGAIDQFRALLGEPSNRAALGQQPSGRRELNFDGEPADPFVNTDAFPADFFNVHSAETGYGLTRGAVFSTPGTGFRLSDNDFSDVNPNYGLEFFSFSPPRTFAPVGSNIMEVTFFVAGEAMPAAVQGFGLVFSGVDMEGSATLELFSGETSLGVYAAPVRSDIKGLSFLGIKFQESVVTRVRITAGQGALGPGVQDVSAGGDLDLVVLDHFIYGEPAALAETE